ncbi:conditioned medium-induced protein 4 [Halarchaeum sp. CBA1220]|uniref:conditioned medium-induced protein 4 n=1 Tax=Halarchaeum sp. CBA1220 TaxID=1853682 RepID=UPI000F3A9D24|nr:conditioned medium-induced protein 4 [Halarchaeum sp. CBA1220]QLC33488.1 conditioned medium-induced protein 4 [Halarchaeum sp. CBA1220]
MDEKTQELRDIFIDVTDGDTVTETQEAGHGSLATDAEIDERLHDVVATMREKLDFESDLDTETLVRVVRGFYAGDTDAEIAAELDRPTEAVTEARRDLHLVQTDVEDAPLDLDALRRAIETGDPSDADLADDLGADPETVADYRRVARVQSEIRAVNDQYRGEFEAVLQDRELAERLTTAAQEDGLEDATEGQETNTNL